RFTQVDPIGMGATSLSDPQSLNLYSYCGNDPINRIDPDGLFFKKLFGWIGKIGKIFKWIGIAITIAIGVLSLVGAGAIAFKISLFFAKHSFLGKVLGVGGKLGVFGTPPINGSSGGGVGGFLSSLQDSGGEGGTINMGTTWAPGPWWDKFIDWTKTTWDQFISGGIDKPLMFITGFGDTVGMQIPRLVRDNVSWLNVGPQMEDMIQNSDPYFYGQLTGIAHSTAIGGAFVLRPTTGAMQTVVHWDTAMNNAPNTLRTGQWVMTGGKTWRNYLMSGSPERGYVYADAITKTVSGSMLRWPAGGQAIKGLLGQRIYIGPPFR
ncbi:MAG: hypothetical protein L0287_34100, partial [Anaerolineae bacterium]|nr:hypothetical protein [Anaerolineae bacterium]